MTGERISRPLHRVVPHRRVVSPRDVEVSFARARDRVLEELGPTTPWTRQFFTLAFSPEIRHTGALARAAGCVRPTLDTRFLRACLPSPRRYLANARLVAAADLMVRIEVPASRVALALDYSSPQAFGRTVWSLTGYSLGQFREHLGGDAMLAHYLATLVTPHLGMLRRFEPASAAYPRAVAS